MLIANSEKPVIKLICSRYNNKYSYTSQSTDNILKNVELFDKLSLRFNGRILFVKVREGALGFKQQNPVVCNRL